MLLARVTLRSPNLPGRLLRQARRNKKLLAAPFLLFLLYKLLPAYNSHVPLNSGLQRGKPGTKRILVEGGPTNWGVSGKDEEFKKHNCRVWDCYITGELSEIKSADVVLFKSGRPTKLQIALRPAHQIWVLYLLESPYNTDSFKHVSNVFNWTATYRHDSTLVTPYEMYTPLDPVQLTREPTKNYAEGKALKVAWFASNCYTSNDRLQYVQELATYVQVDMYGACGNLRCPRRDTDKCFEMLSKEYKFYLSFENSNCRDYITEKFFINGLKNDVVPIVMGAAPEDYERAAPPHSYIHVDDFQSPKELADYLKKLDQDDALYNGYFAWKGLWNNFNTFFWCRLCTMAHAYPFRAWYTDVEKWWRGPNVCIGNRSWRGVPRDKEHIADPALFVKIP